MRLSIDTSWRFVALLPTIQLFFIPVKGNRAVMFSFLFWTISITF
jgi:hypothetical protein